MFSGLQPTGRLHLGNYVGAISQWLAAQRDHETILCIADLHALTIPESVTPAALRTNVYETAATLLACGIDAASVCLFVQSRVSAHAELAWLLGCVTPVGWLERAIQFKTRSADRTSSGAGLLTYPVLQAADILLYRADLVPVGEDQRQHLEIARDIARRFHALFGEVFTIPDAMVRSNGARLMGLDDPGAKMSKSVGAVRPGHAIGLIDPPDVIRGAIMRAVTDSGTEVQPANASAGVRNLLTIYELLTGESRDAIDARFAGKGYAVLKRGVADVVVTMLEPIRTGYAELTLEPERVTALLEEGAERARRLAAPTLDRVTRLMGLSPL